MFTNWAVTRLKPLPNCVPFHLIFILIHRPISPSLFPTSITWRAPTCLFYRPAHFSETAASHIALALRIVLPTNVTTATKPQVVSCIILSSCRRRPTLSTCIGSQSTLAHQQHRRHPHLSSTTHWLLTCHTDYNARNLFLTLHVQCFQRKCPDTP